MAPGIALLIGFIVCIGAVIGLGYSLRPQEEGEPGDISVKDRLSLVIAFILGILLLNLVLSGRYSDPKYAESMSKLPAHKRYLQRSSYSN